jgi:phage terminase large subunit
LELEEHVYRPQGAAAELWWSREPEVLVEGPAGTGKTRAICEYCNVLCETYPQIRVLWLRQTLSSLRESVQVTFEEKVLWPGHPLLEDGGSRHHRTHYTYENGSTIVLGGMDKPERLFSTEYDIAVVFEAIETSQDHWEKLTRAIRNNKLPWQQKIADTNPGPQSHWLNRRFPKGGVVQHGRRRLLSRHRDNPSLTPEYIENLKGMTGANRARLYQGLWVSEEGQIWEPFDRAVHMVHGVYERTNTGRHLLHLQGRKDPVELRWFHASIDFGFNAPGCLGIWGIDSDDRSYLLAEYYRRRKNIEWWADRCVELREEFPYSAGVGDSAEPGSIDLINDRLGAKKEDPIFRGVNKTYRGTSQHQLAGLDMVRQRLEVDASGRPLMYFLWSAPRGRDKDLAERRLPLCTVDEIESYVWEKNAEGAPVPERPDRGCADHGCDMTRYHVIDAWGRDHGPVDNTPEYSPGSLGDLLKHQEAWEEGVAEWGA